MDQFDKKEENTTSGYTDHYQDYTSEYRSLDNEDDAFSTESKSNSTIALVMGILSLVFCCCSIVGIIPGVIGIIFASKAKKNGETSGMATGGLVCSIIGIVLGALVTVFYALYGFAVASLVSEWQSSGIMDQIQTMDSAELMEFIQQYNRY